MTLAQVGILAATDLRRRYRSVLGNRRRLLVFLVVGVVMVLPLGGLVVAAYVFGGSVGEGSLPVSMALLRAGAGGLVAMVAVLNAARTVQTAAVPANADGVLTMAAHRDVVAALLFVETIAGGAIVLVPGLLAAIAFGAGAGSALAGLAAVVAVCAIVVLGSVSGIAVGFVVRIALARSKTLSRYRTPIAVALFVGYMYLFVGLQFESVLGPVARGLGATPLGWYADFVFLSTPVETNSAFAVGAVPLTVVAVGALSVLVDWLAGRLWYTESVEGSTATTDSGGLGTVAGLPRPIASVVRKHWLRAWRSPIRLLFVVYPLFFLIAPISEAVRTGVVPPYLPALVALYGAWATGAAFTLNPLGEEGDVLPIVLASPMTGRSYVAGCCLAGLLVGLPASVLGVVVAAVAAGTAIGAAAGSVAIAVVLPAASTGIAAGIGVTVPRFEPVNVTRGRKAVVPSLFGFVVYSLVLTVAAVPALVVLSSTGRELLLSGRAASTEVLGLGVGATVALSALAATTGFFHAVRTFDSYFLE